MNKQGEPLSWQHFRYALVHIAREHLREQLRLAQAVRMARSEKEDYETWQRDVARMTEVPRNG